MGKYCTISTLLTIINSIIIYHQVPVDQACRLSECVELYEEIISECDVAVQNTSLEKDSLK